MIDEAAQQIEHQLDATFEALPFFQLSREEALHRLLLEFEAELAQFDREYASGSSHLAHSTQHGYRRGLTLLARSAFERCGTQLHMPSSDVTEYVSAMLRFAVSYSLASDGYTLSHRGEMTATSSGRRVKFAYGSPEARLRYAINVMAPATEDQRARDAWRAEQQLRSVVASCVRRRSGMKYFTPSVDVWDVALQCAQQFSQVGSLGDELSCGGYTVSSFRMAFLFLSAISRIGLILTQLPPVDRITVSGDETVWGHLIRISREILTSGLRDIAQVPRGDIDEILGDLTFNDHGGGRDIEVTPLLRTGDQYVLPPRLIASYRWEDNLTRVWNTNYPALYGGVATQKARLAREIAETFREKQFLTAQERLIRDQGGTKITDVDVAVAAPQEGTLVIIEAKWPIAPDSLKEMRKADDEIEKGFDQLDSIRSLANQSRDYLLRQLFPEFRQSWRIDKILYLLAVRGFYPTARVNLRLPVVPADFLISFVSESALASLVELIQTVSEQTMKGSFLREYRETTLVFRAIGQEFEMPSWWSGAIPALVEIRAGRNSRCPCGSGVKFKSCCLPLTNRPHFIWQSLENVSG